LTCRGLNSNPGHLDDFTFIFGLYGESCLLVSLCAGGRCGMVGNDKERDRSRRPDAEDRGWSDTCRVLSDRMIGRSGDAVYGLHRARGDEESRFLD
jgi:hypothetical protein